MGGKTTPANGLGLKVGGLSLPDNTNVVYNMTYKDHTQFLLCFEIYIFSMWSSSPPSCWLSLVIPNGLLNRQNRGLYTHGDIVNHQQPNGRLAISFYIHMTPAAVCQQT